MSSLGLSAPEPKKSKTESKRSQNSWKTVNFDSFSTPFSTFLGPGAERPQELISRLFFQLWARRAQMTPVAGKSFRNSRKGYFGSESGPSQVLP